jgi:hypothetical protein
MKKISLLLIILILVVLFGSALAMESSNFQLDWFTPMSGAGGQAVSSLNYNLNFTIGQSTVANLSSPSFQTCLGYWCEAGNVYTVSLPLMRK